MDELTRELRREGLPGMVRMDTTLGSGKVGRGAFITHVWARNGYALSLGVRMDKWMTVDGEVETHYDPEVAVVVPAAPGGDREFDVVTAPEVTGECDDVIRIGTMGDVRELWAKVAALPDRQS